jgi:glutamyl-Q tRNA(Asp) synthetase
VIGIDLQALARRLPSQPLTRFAPSPTGYLHLGHVANAVHVWGLARALGGRVLLRVEDHDRLRCRPEYESALLEDLEWLGLEPDLGTFEELRSGTSAQRQSDCDEIYRAALDRVSRHAPVYACECSRKDIAQDGGEAFHQETRYSGRCRSRQLPLSSGVGVRVAIEPGSERFIDGLLGEQVQDPALQCGDLLLRDRLGNWTYHFAVVVDDARQGIDLVIRGRDLLPSTGRQIRLAGLVGRPVPPVFLHHPLICKPGGVKLSKASGDTAIRELRRQGVAPAAVLGQAAHLTGLLDRARALRAGDLAGLFAPD